MANEMTTYITIVNGDIKVANKLKEIFTPKEGEYNSTTIELINRLYDEDYTWEINLSNEENKNAGNTWPEFKWLGNNVGSKWIYSEYNHNDDPEFCYLIICSAWYFPEGFIKKLSEVLIEIKEDCYLKGTYQDESYVPMGAFIYAKNYNDVEDLDEEIDQDKMWEDDKYREKMHSELNNLTIELEDNYKEVLNDKTNQF